MTEVVLRRLLVLEVLEVLELELQEEGFWVCRWHLKAYLRACDSAEASNHSTATRPSIEDVA